MFEWPLTMEKEREAEPVSVERYRAEYRGRTPGVGVLPLHAHICRLFCIPGPWQSGTASVVDQVAGAQIFGQPSQRGHVLLVGQGSTLLPTP